MYPIENQCNFKYDYDQLKLNCLNKANKQFRRLNHGYALD